MSDSPAAEEHVLGFPCPRCSTVAEDPYEVLMPTVPTDWRCEGCRRPFNVLLMECAHCGAETAVVALSAAEQSSLEDVACGGCGKPYLDHAEEEDDAG